ncbi:MAG: alpha-L-fucosidase, partial [Bacteroidota bacterium]|nr:alpha-L-fucosidase [Bacteroidota bacterium]
MKRFLLPVVLTLLVVSGSFSQTTAEKDRMEWWRNDRFGMFIHWGIYSVPAGEWNGKTDYG